MHATIEQVGEQVVCLDCGVTTVVPPPGKKSAKSKRSFDDIEAYEVMEADDDPRLHPELAAEAFVRIHCEVCESPVSAPRDKIGQLVECPDCGHRQMVRESAKPRRKPIPPGMEMEARQPYELNPAEATPSADKFANVTDDPLSRERARSYGYGEGHRAMPKLPKRPFIDGVVSFLFDRGVIGRVLWLWASTTASSYLIVQGTKVAMMGGYAAIAGVLWVALGSVIALIWLVTAAAIYLTVVSETGNGNNEITWPDAMFLDWMFLGFYFLNSYLATLLPAVALDWLVGSLVSPWGRAAIYVLSVYLLFPIVLLSMLENCSAIAPISVDVLRSIGRVFWAWARFYFAALLVVLVQIFAIALVALGGAYIGGVHLELWFEPPIIIVTTFVYYRLLGRLALCASLSISTVNAGADEESAAD